MTGVGGEVEVCNSCFLPYNNKERSPKVTLGHLCFVNLHFLFRNKDVQSLTTTSDASRGEEVPECVASIHMCKCACDSVIACHWTWTTNLLQSVRSIHNAESHAVTYGFS